MLIWIAPALPWLRDRAIDFIDFLRSIPSLLAPKPTSAGAPYTPPFIGGQCAGIQYEAKVTYTNKTNPNDKIVGYPHSVTGTVGGAGVKNGIAGIYHNGGASFAGLVSAEFYTSSVDSVTRLDGQADSCGNLPNPTPNPSIPDDGLFEPTNPHIGDDNGTVNPAAIVLAPALPLVLVSAIAAGYAAAMAAAAAASDALVAIKKIAEGLDALKTLWDKLKEFLDEWEKNRPSKRDIVRQTYGRILGDGAIDFFPNNNTKFKAIQLDVVITNIPIGYGRYFGSLSPSRYRFRELGYIAFYSVNQGVLEVHSIQFKRTSYQIPELAVGFIYHLGLDEQVKGYAFGTFSVEKT